MLHTRKTTHHQRSLLPQGKGLEKENGAKTQDGIVILISNKINFKPKLIKRWERILHTHRRKYLPR